MKKIFSTIVFLSTFVIAYATSGACSGHGGVNCSYGSDSDGSVICADGWRNSSVSYASMVKCQGYEPYTQPAPTAVIAPTPIVPKPITNIITDLAPKINSNTSVNPTSGPTVNIAKKPALKKVSKNATTSTTKIVNTPKFASSTIIATSTQKTKQLSSTVKENSMRSFFNKLKFW